MNPTPLTLVAFFRRMPMLGLMLCPLVGYAIVLDTDANSSAFAKLVRDDGSGTDQDGPVTTMGATAMVSYRRPVFWIFSSTSSAEATAANLMKDPTSDSDFLGFTGDGNGGANLVEADIGWLRTDNASGTYSTSGFAFTLSAGESVSLNSTLTYFFNVTTGDFSDGAVDLNWSLTGSGLIDLDSTLNGGAAQSLSGGTYDDISTAANGGGQDQLLTISGDVTNNTGGDVTYTFELSMALNGGKVGSGDFGGDTAGGGWTDFEFEVMVPELRHSGLLLAGGVAFWVGLRRRRRR